MRVTVIVGNRANCLVTLGQSAPLLYTSLVLSFSEYKIEIFLSS